MSTQDGNGISFSILPEDSQQQFRLLELPPELLSLIVSENPPTLQFKSSDGSSDNTVDSNAVLCTADKTYHVRQVNTSNSVYITSPAAGEDDPGGSLTGSSVQAIAQSNFTLELIPASNISAIPYLKAILPIYSSDGLLQRKDVITSKAALFKDIPLSNAECEQAWIELACCELSDPARCFVPTARAKAQAWRSIVTAATAKGIDLTAALDAENVDKIIEPDEDWPVEISRAVLRSISSISDTGDITIDQDRCVRRVGLNELESRVDSSSTSSFTQAWADSLPEKWRSAAQPQLLNGSYQIEGQQITFVDTDTLPGKAGANGDSNNSKSTLGAKRKWHEKFRASKKAA